MLVTVFCAPRDRPETTFALDVSPELELRDFVALCELESGIPAGEIQILYVEQPLKDPTRALGTYGVKDGDVVVLRQADRRPPPTQPAFPGLPHIDFRSITVPGTSSSSTSQPAAPKQQQQPSQQQPPHAAQPSTSMAFRGSGSSPQGLDDPALLQQMLLSNPHELSLLKERNPPLAEALLSGDLERFTKVLLEQQQDRAKREQERIRLLTADPFDLDAQAKIEEDIRQHNVEENMTIAMEEAPESFGQVVMLYINCKVNGHPVKAFVDSGAQMTIMSQACAERCNIMRLVDRRWAGIAKGVGTQKIIGRVHLAQVQIEGDFLPCSFSILEDQPMDMLLGLDMLKRHQCSIDLKKSVLLIGTTGTETRFLPEAELPECARLAYGPEGREDARPDEMADRELAEALQRSIQESDTADGQTTSPKSPPFSLPRPLDQMSSSPSQSPPSGHHQNPALGHSLSAPGSMQQASTPGNYQGQLGFHGLPGPSSQAENAASTPHQVHSHPLPAPSNSTLPPIPSPSTEGLPKCTPPAVQAVSGIQASGDPEDEVLPGATEEDAESYEMVNTSMLSQPEDEVLPGATEEDAESYEMVNTSMLSEPEDEVLPGAIEEDAESNEMVNTSMLSHPEDEVLPGATEEDAESDMLSQPEELSPIEPMDQEVDGSGTADATETGLSAPGQQSQEGDERCKHLHQLNPLSLSSGSCPIDCAAPGNVHVIPEPASAEMEYPTGSQGMASSERDQPDSIPSLAAALLELHELLVSNSRAQSHDRSTSSSPSYPFRQDADGLDDNPNPEPCTPTPENTQPTPSTAITAGAEPSDAKANHAAVSDEGPSKCLFFGQDEHLEGQGPPQCPDGSWDKRADRCGQDEASTANITGPEPAGPSAFAGDLEFREPPGGQQGGGAADGRASGADTPDTLGLQTEHMLLSPMAVGSPEEVSSASPPSAPLLAQAPQPTSPAPLLSAPHPFIEQFPAEHIQRIQAAGFSAREAAEALEQAHGIVELALLALLARSITVPI